MRPMQSTIDEVKRIFPNWDDFAIYRHAYNLETARERAKYERNEKAIKCAAKFYGKRN